MLGYSKMHTGVDWAAPTGTPIVAAGNGSVEKAGWANGYGRQVVLRHANGYETTYNHMSGIARGVSPGAQRAAGPGGRLCRVDRAVDRRASALRGDDQRPLREPDDHQAAARPGTRRPGAREFDKERERVEGLLGRGPATAQKAASANGGG